MKRRSFVLALRVLAGSVASAVPGGAFAPLPPAEGTKPQPQRR